VSNFHVHHLEDLMKAVSIPPMLNQVEFHPFLVQKELLEFDVRSGIRHEAWSPLTRGRKLDHQLITRIAKKYGKTNAQVLLRWDLQLGVVTIPKSVHRERIMENSKIFDFELTSEDMANIRSLDAGDRVGQNPDTFTF
jgi:diketogulonate reductase-like aldo/keto reductase